MLSGEKVWRGELWCFAGVFAKSGVQNVVLWWRVCGDLRGKRGGLAPRLTAPKNVTGF
jgi:hypothetical protein